MTELSWRVASVSDRGLCRKENQDNFYVSPDERVFVVADGMGGVKGGAEASRIAIETIQKLWKESAPHPNDKEEIQKWLVDAVALANENICDAADKIATSSRMGTTIVIAVQTTGKELHIAHVGDSRAYAMKDGTASTLTSDHSVVNEMLKNNRITVEQCRTSPFKHLLTRCLGHHRDVEVEKTEVEIVSKQWIILCSDGLSSVLSDEQIGASIETCESADQVCQNLLSKTLEAGAPDNVTIVAIQYEPAGEDGSNNH